MTTTCSSDLADLSLTAVVHALRAGDFTSVEYVAALLTRVDATEPDHHAFTWIDRERLFTDAAAADRESAKNGRGLLHGVPVGVKDLIEVAGLPCTGGCAGWAGKVPDSEATVVRQLRGQGAIVLGKQATHELGVGLDDPGTRNAWDPDRYPGGSSAGGAVSVALGSAPAALGTDAGGSVRKPASLNGVVGFKPSHRALSMDGVLPSARTLDEVGWLTRDVMDCALFWRAFGGHIEKDVPMRLGWLDLPPGDLHQDIARAAEHFRATLIGDGLDLVNVPIPDLSKYQDAHAIIGAAELAQAVPPDKRHMHHKGVLSMLTEGASITNDDLLSALQARANLRRSVDEALRVADCELLLLPTTPLPPLSMDELDPPLHLSTYCRLTHPFNLTGQPAISVPVERAGAPFPIGMQIVGRRSRDALVIGTALLLERRGLVVHETPTNRRTPPPNTPGHATGQGGGRLT